jgi:hypothetical protein
MYLSWLTYFLRFYYLMNRFTPEGDLLKAVNVLSEKYGDLPPETYEGGDAKKYISEEYYNIHKSSDIPEAEMSVLRNLYLKPKEKYDMIRGLAKVYNSASIIQSGDFYYPAKGYMGWHTNSNTPGRRVYVTYSAKAGENSFLYIKDGKIVKDYDDAGWTAREFIVGDQPNNLFWHAVDAVIPRISMGFRVFDNLA